MACRPYRMSHRISYRIAYRISHRTAYRTPYRISYIPSMVEKGPEFVNPENVQSLSHMFMHISLLERAFGSHSLLWMIGMETWLIVEAKNMALS